MKPFIKKIHLTLVLAVLSSMSLFAQQRDTVLTGEDYRFAGNWPLGKGVLYSYKDGLVMGDFSKGVPNGECVCYMPNGEVYWGHFKKGKATGYGRLYRGNDIVFAGGFKNGRYHGTDTLFRTDGSVFVGQFKKGKLKKTIANMRPAAREIADRRPGFPRIDLKDRHEDFLKELELKWEERNLMLRTHAGLVNPKFQGGSVEDFTFWVNSNVVYPESFRDVQDVRTVIVEFTVLKDGTVTGVSPIFGTDKDLNDAAVKAVAKSPKWEPAEQNGEKKSVRLRIPVVFNP